MSVSRDSEGTGSTRPSRTVWDQLAQGSRELCGDRVPGLGRGFAETPLLLTKSPVPEAEARETEVDEPDAPELEPPEDLEVSDGGWTLGVAPVVTAT